MNIENSIRLHLRESSVKKMAIEINVKTKPRQF